MLLEFAAQAKWRSQRSLTKTAVTIAQAPAEFRTFIVQFKRDVVNLIFRLQESLKELREKQSAKAKEKKKLEQTEKRLKAAQELLKKGDSIIDRMDNILESKQPEESSAESPQLSSITDQLAKLKQQMELFAQMQAIKANVESNNIPADPVENSPASSDFPSSAVPVAPPLGDYQNQGNSSPQENKLSVEIPLAPPFSPVFHQIPKLSPSSSAPPAAPEFRRSVEPASRCTPSLGSSITFQSPNLHHRTPSLNIPSQVLSPRSPGSGRARKSFGRSPNTLAVPLTPAVAVHRPDLQLKVFTRNIPGEDSLSHTDLIKVAAAVKLRRTAIPRSPGGTPARSQRLNDPFAEALFQKFKNTRQSDNFSNKFNSRQSNGFANETDKENWETN